MKAIMISIKPEWVAKILNGEKTIEIRKTMPKCDLPIDVYIYCTLNKENLVREELTNKFALTHIWNRKELIKRNWLLNGKVVAKFTLNKVEKFTNDDLWAKCFKTDELIAKSCVRFSQITAYSCASSIYAWHIDNLEIFDEPKELSEFSHWVKYQWETIVNGCEIKSVLAPLTKAPQNYCYIETEDK